MCMLWEMGIEPRGDHIEGPGIQKNNILFVPIGMTEFRWIPDDDCRDDERSLDVSPMTNLERTEKESGWLHDHWRGMR